jgi:acyl-CoA synthetase (AMP-forming)/AMP-acid ligase II
MVELCRRAGAGLLVARDEAAAALEPHLASHGIRVLPHSALAIRGPFVAELPGAQDPAFVQFSSGTTGRPRGAVLTTAAIEAQLERLAEAIELSSEDRGSMWLPLSHDMGLFGGLMLAWTHSLPFALSHPEQFLRAPRSWLEECREFGATVTAGPSFALDVACRAHTTGPPPRDLRLRACIVGGERVRMQTMSRAGSLLEQGGASARALTPAYGLAEATLAVTVSDLDEPPRALSVEASGLADARVVPAATPGAPQIACVGRPLRDVELDIDGGEIGEIVVRSPSQASGYVGDASATRARFSPQGVRTGDVGFLRHGELYVVGREDDLLIIGGRNLHAGVVESQLREHPAISGRACTVVDVADAHSSRLVAYVEPTPARHDWDLLTSTLRALARRSAGIQIREWVYLDVGSTPKTPSGKVNRFRMRQSGVVDGVRASRTVG